MANNSTPMTESDLEFVQRMKNSSLFLMPTDDARRLLRLAETAAKEAELSLYREWAEVEIADLRDDVKRHMQIATEAEARLRDSCLEGRGDQEFPPCARAIEAEARAAAAEQKMRDGWLEVCESGINYYKKVAAANEKDAQRYRWLCAGRMEFGVQDKPRGFCWWRDSIGMEQEEINDIIDAAMGERDA